MSQTSKGHSPFGVEKDMWYMKQALMQAHKAALLDEVPIGAVVVNGNGDILSRSYNLVEKSNTQTAHAELRALAKAGKKINDWRLDGCWIYVTLQPCAMCLNSIKISRCAGIVYGAESPLFGYHLDNSTEVSLYHRDTLEIVKGVHSQDSVVLLKQFFKQKRKHKSG